MGTEGVYSFTEIQGTKPTKVAHKVHLVTPRMDVDVTGVSFKHMRTTIIDHPRDEGLRHREQLWNYQQRYRGAIGKLKSLATSSAVANGEGQPFEELDDFREEESNSNNNNNNNNVRGSAHKLSVDRTSLQTRFRKRLSNKLKIASLRHSEVYLDSAARSQPQTERRDTEKMGPPCGIQRLYSSGLIVKNSLYKQIRHGESSGDIRQPSIPDNSRIQETIEKFGSLERLPDIIPSQSDYPLNYSLQALKSLSSYSRRVMEQASHDRRITPLQRAQTITDMARPSMKKIFNNQASRRHEMNFNNSSYVTNANGDDDDEEEEDNDDDDDDDGNNDDDDDDDADDEQELDDDEEDDYDECDDGTEISGAIKLHTRDCDKKRPDHVAIRSNVTSVNTQDDLALIHSRNSPGEVTKNAMRKEQTFHVSNSTSHIVASLNYAKQDEIKRVYKYFVKSATVNKTKGKQQTNGHHRTSDNQQTTDQNLPRNEAGEIQNQTSSTNKEVPPKATASNKKTEDVKEKLDKPVIKDRRDRRSSIKCPSRKENKDNRNERTGNGNSQGKDTMDKDDQDESDDSLDIPKDRFGHTTHTLEKKLSIRKPWEWKPCPFRWIDKPYVRESDKPYIERVLNRGEIIDEFTYDSYARTKPLKLQNYPEHAGYKDRYGVMR